MGENEFFSLVGPSGCGKTTSLRCIAGLETATSGKIDIGSRTVFQAQSETEVQSLVPTHERSIGMVFQNYAVWPHMSVFQNIAYPPSRPRGPRAEQGRGAAAGLGRLGRAGYLNPNPAHRSGARHHGAAAGERPRWP